MTTEDIYPGDMVAINHGLYGRKEGLVVGSHVDYAGRQIVEVQLEPGEIYNAWYPTVTRIKRTISYQPSYHSSYQSPYQPSYQPSYPVRHPSYRTVERRIMW